MRNGVISFMQLNYCDRGAVIISSAYYTHGRVRMKGIAAEVPFTPDAGGAGAGQNMFGTVIRKRMEGCHGSESIILIFGSP